MTVTAQLALLGGQPIRTRPFHPWPAAGSEELRLLRQVLDSHTWGGVRADSQVAAFESEFAAYHGSAYALCVANGTAALTVALRALDVGPGDEVVVPALTYIATATAVTLAGATPVFVDVDADTHCICPDQLAAAISVRTKAVIPVHLYGHPADMHLVMTIARRHGLAVVEDCAQATGAAWHGDKVGTFADLGAFSFANNKNLAAGEGGALITDDPGLARRVAELRNHGRPPGLTDQHTRLGQNLRLTEFQAAILRAQLSRLDHHLETKRQAADHLSTQIRKRTPWLVPLPDKAQPGAHGLFCLPLRHDTARLEGVSTHAVRAALHAESIPVVGRPIRPCPDQPIYRDPANPDHAPSRTLPCPTAEAELPQLIMLGQAAGSGLLLDDPDELEDVIRALEKIEAHQGQLRRWDQVAAP